MSKIVHKANLIHIFDSSTNVALSNFETCLPAIHYMTKHSTLTESIQALKKTQLFFGNQILYLLRYLVLSVAFCGWRLSNSKPDTSVKSDIIKWQKTFDCSVLCRLFSSIFLFGRRNKNLSDSKNRDEQHLNVILTIAKTKRLSEKPWFRKLTSEEKTWISQLN